MLIDSHTHLDSKEFDNDREEVIARAKAAGVSRIITIGASDGFNSAERVQNLIVQHDFIFASVGIHPHDAAVDLDILRLKALASHPKVVAIGETGLDFYRDWSPQDRQKIWFEAQIALAIELKKPLIIHSRDAAVDCYEMLSSLNAREVGGVFHCYSEDADFAKKLLDINFLVSFPGTITFKKSQNVRDAAKAIPLQRIMVETDAPYMAPEPYRGKRCETAYVVETAKMLAQVKGVPFEEVARVTSENAIKLFNFFKSF